MYQQTLSPLSKLNEYSRVNDLREDGINKSRKFTNKLPFALISGSIRHHMRYIVLINFNDLVLNEHKNTDFRIVSNTRATTGKSGGCVPLYCARKIKFISRFDFCQLDFLVVGNFMGKCLAFLLYLCSTIYC